MHQHRGGCPCRGAPDCRRAGQDVELAHDEAAQRTHGNNRENNSQEQRPVCKEARHDTGADGFGDHRADQRLGAEKGGSRQADGAAIHADNGAGDHRPHQQSSRNAGQFEPGGKDCGEEKKEAPLHRGRPAADARGHGGGRVFGRFRRHVGHFRIAEKAALGRRADRLLSRVVARRYAPGVAVSCGIWHFKAKI